MKKAYVLLANGFELIEALTPVAVLRRGGVKVATVSIYDKLEVTSSNHVTIKADTILDLEKMVLLKLWLVKIEMVKLSQN